MYFFFIISTPRVFTCLCVHLWLDLPGLTGLLELTLLLSGRHGRCVSCNSNNPQVLLSRRKSEAAGDGWGSVSVLGSHVKEEEMRCVLWVIRKAVSCPAVLYCRFVIPIERQKGPGRQIHAQHHTAVVASREFGAPCIDSLKSYLMTGESYTN